MSRTRLGQFLWYSLHYEKFADGSVKCIEDEIPFELPEGWAWARLASLIELFITGPFGSTLHKSDYVTDGIPLINPINIIDGKIIPVDKMQVSSETVKRLSSFKVATNDIVIARRGDMGRCAVVQPAQEGWLCGTGSFILRLPAVLCSEYFAVCLRSPYAVEHMSVNSIGNTMLNLNQTILKSILIPVPPCAEQNRIIKVIFDATHLLAKAAEHSEELAVCVAKAKVKILDLAIRGQLVPQDPADEPASVLLERIRAEKEELIKQGKLKRDKKESVIFKGEDNSYYGIHLPDSWDWASLREIALSISDGSHNPPPDNGSGIPLLSAANINDNSILINEISRWITNEEWKIENQRTNIEVGDVLLTIVGSIGRSAVVQNSNHFALQRSVAVIKPCLINPLYLMHIVQSPQIQKWLTDNSKGTAQKGIYLNALSLMIIPIPPLAEQARIVEQIHIAYKQLDLISNALL